MINLLPKDTVFYDLFEGISNHVVSVAEHLATGQELPGDLRRYFS